MTNKESIERLDQKVRYLRTKLESLPETEKSRYWIQRDLEAMMNAVAALIYVEEVREYEASQFPTA